MPEGGTPLNEYQNEHLQCHREVQEWLAESPESLRGELRAACADYLAYRGAVDEFLRTRFAGVCTRDCFRSRRSACCSREGIVAFFADVLVNALLSPPDAVRELIRLLEGPPNGFKCIYLGPEGCRWKLKPLGCELFVCDSAAGEVFSSRPGARRRWEEWVTRARAFRWPDRPVLFDWLEARFIRDGRRSPLMYLHESPGLLRVKRLAGRTGDRREAAGP